MNFHAHRPHQHLGRSELALMRIATELTSFLLKAQRSLTFETLHLLKHQREAVAQILVEFTEDLHQDIGIWRSLERYNRDFFRTPLPCILSAEGQRDASHSRSRGKRRRWEREETRTGRKAAHEGLYQ